VDTSRISFGETVAAASGFVLFVLLFFPWYEVSSLLGSESFNAWQSFGFIDLVLFLVSAVAVGAAVARAGGVMPAQLPAPPGQIVAAAGGLAVLLILFRLIDTPGGDTSEGIEVGRKIGAFLGLLAAGGVAFGGYTAMQEEAPGRAPPRAPRQRP
jgi:hypothetical protein